MTEIGNRFGQTQVYLGVAKCWLGQKEFDKVLTIMYKPQLQNVTDRIVLCFLIMAHPPSLFIFQALDSLQRAQELADGMGNKVTGAPHTGQNTHAELQRLAH